jgi:DNA-binding IclR family transcriptional regulator
VSVARSALVTARRALERVVVDRGDGENRGESPCLPDHAAGAPRSALAAAIGMLRVLARGDATVAELAAASALRRDRTARLVDSCLRAGLVRVDPDAGRLRLDWSVHGWLRAAVAPVLVERGGPLVADAADRAGVCAFITVLRGMRSVTLVEELRSVGPGLEMTPWLGRPCPLLSSDGGPALVMDFDPDDILAMLPRRSDPREVAEFVHRVEVLAESGVVARESFEEAGQTAVTAPVRDAGGDVVASACLVGASDQLRPRLTELADAARALARELSALVGGAAETPNAPTGERSGRSVSVLT